MKGKRENCGKWAAKEGKKKKRRNGRESDEKGTKKRRQGDEKEKTRGRQKEKNVFSPCCELKPLSFRILRKRRKKKKKKKKKRGDSILPLCKKLLCSGDQHLNELPNAGEPPRRRSGMNKISGELAHARHPFVLLTTVG
ncbi:hypothetical protein POVWA2_051430 [Plasmodium ovale wallikeri]|uniref:Uncharacterized protein n=1 Tax=Plasmodium ovale wallikeri TaxID=864142 RepID=A0A1A8ZQM8_PLAOA|nr:hypothetical protein POVWA2_051430 [Plasmodium ovale wallikeri]